MNLTRIHEQTIFKVQEKGGLPDYYRYYISNLSFHDPFSVEKKQVHLQIRPSKRVVKPNTVYLYEEDMVKSVGIAFTI